MTKTGNRFDHEIRLLQGDGAGSIYHARVYEGMAEAGHALTCMVGVSIGVIIAALIAGNPPERRVERLRAFRERFFLCSIGMARLGRRDAGRDLINRSTAARFAFRSVR
jgi:predicted acylesterase/phospholipase RssA